MKRRLLLGLTFLGTHGEVLSRKNGACCLDSLDRAGTSSRDHKAGLGPATITVLARSRVTSVLAVSSCSWFNFRVLSESRA